MPLNRDQITQAAVELLDDAGLGGLSTRRLAARLGVQSPTLYWHVRSKAELLDLVACAICADAVHVDVTAPWRTQLESGLRQLRAVLARHRDAAALLRDHPGRLPHADTFERALAGAGLTVTEASEAARVLVAYVLNAPDDLADLGVTLLLDGLDNRIGLAHRAGGHDRLAERIRSAAQSAGPLPS